MATIAQRYLFSWKEIDAASDLDRLRLVLDALSLVDEDLMVTLEKRRGRGRDDYPIRTAWNAVIAGIVYQHRSIESLRRELRRNAELRQLCGFDPFKGAAAVPGKDAFSRFLNLLMRHQTAVLGMFHCLVDELKKYLPSLGEKSASDSKAIQSFGKPVKDEQKLTEKDRRRDVDADCPSRHSLRSFLRMLRICEGRAECEKLSPVGVNDFGRIVRVPLELDRRIFTPIARHTEKWKKAYRRRTSVERVNSRIDQVLGFEHHTIRGKAKMETRVTLALVVLLAMALGRIRIGQADKMCSLVSPVRRAS